MHVVEKNIRTIKGTFDQVGSLAFNVISGDFDYILSQTLRFGHTYTFLQAQKYFNQTSWETDLYTEVTRDSFL